MLKRLYHWMLEKAAHPLAERWLAGISFAESSFFPIPPDVMLAPMALSRPQRALRYALIATLASVAGAVLGWIIGASLFETVGKALLDIYGAGEKFAEISTAFNERGWIIVLIAGFTPIPFKVITIASGATGLSIYVLLAASLISRGGRFFLLGGLLKLFGEPMKRLLEKHFGLITSVIAAVGIGGFFAVRYVF